MNKIAGIYQIKNIINNKVYIGKSKNIFLRWFNHTSDLINNKHSNYKLQEDFNKYGYINFTFSIVEIIDSLNRLTKKEQEYISQQDSTLIYNLINSDNSSIPINEKEFIDYINKKWLVPKGLNEKQELDKYKIYKPEDKEEIIRMVIKCKLLKLFYSQVTFNKVVDLMQDSLGYSIESNRIKIKQKKYTYKLIIDFDEDKVDLNKEVNII